ncbi:hypothetical protein H9L39_14630 [Fusarium oxysporum f. sp. albedinis]|nr:hypothetical protein H9L39_14630 [Fusarium oxysporum f. sp. albedinis]
MPTNRAAWIRGPKSYPLEVGPATFPTPKSGEVIIKAQTYALNPVEWKVQEQDFFVKTYPFILGADVAGYVEDVGEGVTHVQKGQRVMGKRPSIWWFPALPYSVCFVGLSNSGQSELRRGSCGSPCCDYGSGEPIPPLSPRLATSKPKPSIQWQGHFGLGRIIFSGSTAIQLSVASGLEVISTASKLNHSLVKSVGATTVLDYKSPTIVQDIVSVLSGRELVGIFDAISEPESMRPVSEILDQVGSHKVGLVVPPTIELSKNFIPTLCKASHEHIL